MLRIECAANQYVAKTLAERVGGIIRATADCTESFGIDDIMYSAGTEANFVAVPCENKCIKGGFQLKYDSDWNNYFTTGIYNKLVFMGEPPKCGTPIYFINATNYDGDFSRGKFKKLIDNQGSLTFFAPDGILFYTPEMLKEAFVGYADYYVRPTTEFGGNNNRRWETKAVLRLDKGLYIPCNPSMEYFEK